MLVYLDAVIVIYAVEGAAALHAQALTRLAALRGAGHRLAISDLTELECRVLPLRTGDAALSAAYDAFFADPDLVRVALPPAVYRRATAIRAHHRYEVADSLHLAAAVESGCGLFLTNDLRLRAFPDIAVEVLT